MPWTRDTERSLRFNIVQHLATRFKDAVDDQGAPVWHQVLTDPVSKTSAIQAPSIGLYDPDERKNPEVGYKLCTLVLAVEFFLRPGLGEEGSDILDRYHTLIYKTIRKDINCGGLCLNSVENRFEKDIDGPDDRLVGGISFWELTYRHKANDPTKLVGE